LTNKFNPAILISNNKDCEGEKYLLVDLKRARVGGNLAGSHKRSSPRSCLAELSRSKRKLLPLKGSGYQFLTRTCKE